MQSRYTKRDRWKPSKKCSAAQRAISIGLTTARITSEKENHSPAVQTRSAHQTLQTVIENQNTKVSKYERRYRNERRCHKCATSLAASRTVKVSQRGAVKALSLAGAVFRHKDDKKGQQDSLQFFLEANLRYFCPWPDTSNIRYQSNCDAACEWLVHREMYITYLELVMDKKETRTHTNIEHNVYDTFHCDKTTQEMICLAIWGQCISHPYLCNVRSSGDNILDLGPLHSRLVSHVKNLLTNPDLVLGPEATLSSATLNRTPFECPEVIYVIQSLVQDKTHFPHIRPLFAAYLEVHWRL
ncbi:hypothetical protein PAXRUDRAFT_150079 [Paxillus rubicundulus Ve08.2h10]|uniref:Uncharacterized protein n=1 Tax=Paxillus rubicundulus Ve08.2h10 TaxID=930991 RepID=A0A0D0DJB1_9AGAM|nr:hypothetical protein PAXRUDRAFT_150079 [Paxillus rubicundulus Ve08.2h10]